MGMVATSWTVTCNASMCADQPGWPAKSKPLTVKGDRAQAIAAAEKAGWRRCWSRNGAGERKVMRPRSLDGGWWCPWHVQWIMAAEAERDRKDAELKAALDRAVAHVHAADKACHPAEGQSSAQPLTSSADSRSAYFGTPASAAGTSVGLDL